MKFGTDQEGKRLTQRWVSEVLLEGKSPKRINGIKKSAVKNKNVFGRTF